MQGYYRIKKEGMDRLTIVVIGSLAFAAILLIRLFSLQVTDYERYKAIAADQQITTSVDPATRGNVYIHGDKSGTPSVIAENVLLYLLYIDPNPYNEKELDSLVDTAYISSQLAPLVYEHFCEGGELHTRKGETCQDKVLAFSKGIEDLPSTEIVQDKEEESTVPLGEKEYSEDELHSLVERTIKAKSSAKEVDFVPLLYTKDTTILASVEQLQLSGIYVGEGIIYGNPLEVMRKDDLHLTDQYAELAPILSTTADKLSTSLTRRLSRYAFLLRRMTPEMREKIMDLRTRETLCPQLYLNPEKKEGLLDASDIMCQKLRTSQNGKVVRNFFGLATREENWRNYPENDLASQVVGFLNFEKDGNYGVEEEFDSMLRGSDGEIKIEADPMGRIIASNLKAEQIRDREDGIDVHLTIDRVVQRYVEQELEATVKNTQANSGQAVVMNPYTGEIVSMAQYPTFNPNYYSDVYELEETSRDPGRGMPFFMEEENTGELVDINDYERGGISSGTKTFRYVNKLGPSAYYNHAVQGTYEPGSIFKPLIMAAGIDSGELKVDEFTIRNVSSKCLGTHNMVNVLNNSCNIGMSFVAGKLGKALLYKYIVDFGFGERTEIELPNEARGTVEHFEEWSTARQYNVAFGQGLTVTPLQMAASYAVLANGGVLIHPHIIEKIVQHPSLREVMTQTKEGRRVIAKETADTVTAMLTSVAEEGGSKNARVDKYYIAGKTGTAQIASSQGGYEDGAGTTIGSFAGYLPADNPMFVIVTKIDRPRTTQWADQSAAPLFQKIGTFLMEYYNVPPER